MMIFYIIYRMVFYRLIVYNILKLIKDDICIKKVERVNCEILGWSNCFFIFLVVYGIRWFNV